MASRARLVLIMIMIGRTLEETAALFDGEKPQRDLARVAGEAAIINADLPIATYPLTERSKTVDSSIEDWLGDVSSQKLNFEPSGDPSLRRQSLESNV